MSTTSDTKGAAGLFLRREIGLLQAIALIIGAIIGSGIFISPKGVLETTGSPGMALVIWIICGLIAISGAMTIMELQLAMSSSGGHYYYFWEVLGPIPAFIYLWVFVFISAPSGYAILSLAISKYVVQAIFPNGDYDVPDESLRLMAATLILLFAFLNCYDVRFIARLQQVFLFGKIVPLVFIIMMGVTKAAYSGLGGILKSMTFNGTIQDPGKIALAMYYGGFTYAGWDALASITEEIKNPNRNMPLSIYISIPLITGIYVLTNIAYLLVLTPTEFVESNAIAVTFIQKMYGGFGWVMCILVSLSVIGSLTIEIMVTSRQLFVGARNNQFPRILGYIKQSTLTPVPAIAFLTILSLFYLSTSDIFILIDYSSYMLNINMLGIVAVFIYLRLTKPNLVRPVKVSIVFPIIFLFSCIFMVIFPIYTRPIQVALGVTIALCGLPIYFIFFHLDGKPRQTFLLQKISAKTTELIQKIFLCLPEG